EPNVKQRQTPYPNTRFQPGDRVTVFANGCVQTGGSGRTWKRYVDPQGPKSSQLYHGLVEIPGATPHLVRIQSILGQELTVQKGLDPKQYFLRLGYEDDGYGDNGYWGHDDGTGDQCKGVGSAWVIVRITHLPAQVVVAPPPIRAGAPLAMTYLKPFGIVFEPAHGLIY